MNTNEYNGHWPVNWSGVFVGALAALATALIFGLASIAIGAQMVEFREHIVRWDKVRFAGIICSVCSAFFSFVVGGWVAGKITGYTRAETTMLHGAIAWLLAVPCLLFFAALGAGGYFGAWYTGLHVATTSLPAADATAIIRNNALGALTALVLGLIGSILGGWMASGQPMTISWGADEHDKLHENVAIPSTTAAPLHTP